MHLNNFLSISIFAALLISAPVFARDYDEDRRERFERDREQRWDGHRRGPAWDNEKEWREYLKERRKSYKEWRKANREEQREFEKYLRERERYAREIERERDREWREYLREQRREYKEWAKASRWEQDDFDRYRGNRRDRSGGYYDGWSGNSPLRGGVCFYTDSNYRGDTYCLDSNDYQSHVGKRYNDRISSIRIFGGVRRVIVYEHDDFGGSRRIIAGDMPSLGNFNDKISSVDVR